MGIIIWIVVGLIAGFVATRLTGTPGGGPLRNIAIGLVGAIVGGFLAGKLGLAIVPDFWGHLITATLGAVTFLIVWQAIRRA